jgi:hypothetical protein
MSQSATPNPMASTVRWLSSFAGFPASRLETKAEAMLLIAALAETEAESLQAQMRLRGDRSFDRAAYKAHAMNRSHAHFKSDNSAKV